MPEHAPLVRETPFEFVREGQAKAQETISKTLTPEYLRYKLYDGQNSKMVLLPDNLKLPLLINPGEQQSAQPASTEIPGK